MGSSSQGLDFDFDSIQRVHAWHGNEHLERDGTDADPHFNEQLSDMSPLDRRLDSADSVAHAQNHCQILNSNGQNDCLDTTTEDAYVHEAELGPTYLPIISVTGSSIEMHRRINLG